MADSEFNYFSYNEDMWMKYGSLAEEILTQETRKLFVRMQIRKHLKENRAAELTLITFPVYCYRKRENKWEKNACSKEDKKQSTWEYKGDVRKGRDEETEFNWIDKEIWNFINSYAERNAVSRSDPYEGPTLYWAVLQDTDFKPDQHKNFPKICGTQVYVGKAKLGIERRWAVEGHNHCQNMFDIILLGKKPSLVDTRLLLANLRKERWCVFAIPVKRDQLENEEAKHIAGHLSPKVMNKTAEAIYGKWTPLNVKYGMNMQNTPEEQQSNASPAEEISALKRLQDDEVDYKHLSMQVNGKFEWSESLESLKSFVNAVLETDIKWTVESEVKSFRNSYFSIDIDKDKVLHISGDKGGAIIDCFKEVVAENTKRKVKDVTHALSDTKFDG